MAKRSAKKTTKKTPAKKKAKARPKKASSKKSSASSLPVLKTYLKGKRIAFSGRFSRPDKPDIEKFFTSCGGKITETIDGKLDILLTGKGRKQPPQNKAEKLNAKGEASILIIDKPILVIPDFVTNHIEYLMSPEQFALFNDIAMESWLVESLLYKDDFRKIDGFDFSKKTIGPNLYRDYRGLWYWFRNCRFDSSTIQNIEITHYAGFEKCELNSTLFKNAHINELTGCKFNKCKGSLELTEPRGCQFDSLAMDELQLNRPTNCDISNSKIKELEVGRGAGQLLKNCTLENVKIGHWKSGSCDIDMSEFSKVNIAAIDMDGELKCHASVFKDCKFTGLNADFIDFNDCKLINCTFDRLETRNLSFSKTTTLKNCRFAKPNIVQISASDKQLAQTKGIP